MSTIISPSMGLPVPVVGVEPGPDWASDINACMSIIDSHNHTPGSGVFITPDAIDINSDLTMANNDLTNARSVRFYLQGGALAGAADLACLYAQTNGDLYFNDGSGNVVRITQSGSVTGATGTITGLPSGTASASFAAATFTFQSATSTPAIMNFGTIILGQTVASGKNVTIAAAGSQPANYSLTLPLALPAIQSSLTSDASGNLSFSAIASGTFTPVVSNVSNIVGTSNINPMTYTRTGAIVTCFGSLDVQVINASQGIFRISLPITPVFVNVYDLNGQGSAAVINTPMSAQIYAAVVLGLAEFRLFGNGSSNTINYSFSYLAA